MFLSDMIFFNGSGLVYFSLQQVILSADPPPLQGFGPRSYWTLSTVKLLNKMTSTLIPMARTQTFTHTINLDPELKFPKVQECLDLGPTHFLLSAGCKPRGGEQRLPGPSGGTCDISHVILRGVVKSLIITRAKLWCLSWVLVWTGHHFSQPWKGRFTSFSHVSNQTLPADTEQGYLKIAVLLCLTPIWWEQELRVKSYFFLVNFINQTVTFWGFTKKILCLGSTTYLLAESICRILLLEPLDTNAKASHWI